MSNDLELKEVLEEFYDMRAAYIVSDIKDNIRDLRNDLKALSQTYDFVEFESDEDILAKIDLFLVNNLVGNIDLTQDQDTRGYLLSLRVFDTNDSEIVKEIIEIRFNKNNIMAAVPRDKQNDFGIEAKLCDRKLVQYLFVKLLTEITGRIIYTS